MRRVTLWMTALVLVGTLFSGMASANEVEVVKVRFEWQVHAWQVSATLRHADSGWEHYADGWRVVDAKGEVLGTRTLHHPHENEQPFTRSLGNVLVPPGVTTVFVEAHDKRHGWSGQRVRVDLNQARGERFEVLR